MLRALARVALMTAMQYRASFLVELIVGMGTAAAVVIPLGFVYQLTDTITGWTYHEAMLVTAFFLVLQGLVGALVEPNLGAIVEGIRSGQLDYLLLKPPDAQLVASLQRVAPARFWDVLAGSAIGGWALSHLTAPTFGAVLAALALLISGLCAIYGLWVLVVCTSFWFVRVDNLRYLLGSVMDAGRWPVTIYRGIARLVLTVIIPVAVVTSYPALALLGRLDPALALEAAAVALGMLLVSRFAWVQALRHYTSASS